MKAVELFHANGKPAGIYHCEKCRLVFREKDRAEECCAPLNCRICGKEVERNHYLICSACSDEECTKKEAQRFAEAEKLTEWDGPVWDQNGTGFNEGFFENLSAYEEHLDQEAEEVADNEEPFRRPEYVWTCDDIPFCQVDFDRIIEQISEESWGDWDSADIEGAKEFEAAIKVFNEANKHHVSWQPNLKVAVLLSTYAGTGVQRNLAR